MGYVPPNYEDLPLPTLNQFTKDQDFYQQKLKQFKRRHFIALTILKLINWLLNKFWTPEEIAKIEKGLCKK